MDKEEMPMGFGMALNQNTEAMIHYAAMSKEQQKALRDQARTVNTKEEMYRLVAKIANGTI